MEPSKIIAEALAKDALSLAGPIIRNPAVEGGVYLPIAIRRDAEGRQIPSPETLRRVQTFLQTQGVVAEFHHVDEAARVAEEGLRESLLGTFSELVEEVVVSSEAGSLNVWVQTKRELTGADSEALKEHVRKFGELFKARSTAVHIANEANLASNAELLALIRRLAPVDCYRLETELKAREFDVPSLTWINHKFDALRKAGFLIRMPDRSYVLTALALHRMGTTKGRNSPDISRLLFIARGMT